MSVVIEHIENTMKSLMTSILENSPEMCHLSLLRIEQTIREIKSFQSSNKKTIENVIILSYFLIFFRKNKIGNFQNYEQSMVKYLEIKFTPEERSNKIHHGFLKYIVRFVSLIDVHSAMLEMLVEQEQKQTLNQIIQYLNVK
jgi:hypothetical protein